MFLRYGLLMALLCVLFTAANAADLGPVAALDRPQVAFTRQAGVFLRQDATLALAAGENRLLFDFGRYDIDPATLQLRVLAPADGVALIGQQFPPRQPGQTLFLITAQQAGQARLRLTYALKGLEAEVCYTALLAPAQQSLKLEAQLTLRNNGKQELRQARVALPSGHALETTLDVGQSLQQALFTASPVAYQVTYLYDNTRFKDSVRAILKLARDGDQPFDKLPLPAGKVRVFAPTAGTLPTFIAETAVKYTPAHEKLELDLGIVPEITVLRTKLRGDQINARTDIYRKLAVFDLEEEYEFEVENHRAGAVTLVLQEHVAGDWQVLKSSVPHQKLDAGTLELTLKLDPGQKTKLSYVVKRLNVEP